MDEQMTELVASVTTPESEPEETTPSEPAESEAATLAQPVEEASVEEPQTEETPEAPKSRSKERIQELSSKVKSLKEEVDYWKNLTKQPEVLPVEESEDGVTVDQIATAVLNKQAEAQAKKDRDEATKQLKADIAATVEVYPELDTDDEMAAIVVSIAEKRHISIKSAADLFMGKLEQQKKVTEKKTLATQALKVGVSSPQGGSVGDGSPAPLDLSSMSEEEKEANWNKILMGLSQ